MQHVNAYDRLEGATTAMILSRLLKGTQIAPERRLSQEARTSITIHSLFQFGASMAGLFLNLYLWRLTEDLFVNGVYSMFNYLLTPVGFAVGGWIAKRRDRLVTYRLGILMMAIFFLLVIITQESVVNYYILFAVLNGFSSGLYWTGYQVLMYDVSTEQNRLRFLALNMTFFNAAGLVGPALAGFIIGRSEGLQGYIITFMIAFVMFVAAAVVSLRIKAATSHHKSYYLHMMLLLMRKNRVWFRALCGFFIMGMLQGLMLFLPNILLFRTVGREDWVGYLGVLFSGLLILSGYIISRKAKEEAGRRYMLISTTGVVLGAAFLLLDVSFWTVAAFMVLFSLFNPLMMNTLTTFYYRIISMLPLRGQLRQEAVVVREVFINVGRILAITLLLLFAHDLDSIWLPIVLLASALLQYGIYFLVKSAIPTPSTGR
jgi:MFS transporter, YQGE family, putative transporter